MQINQNNINILPESKRIFEIRDNKKYKLKSVINSVMYNKEIKSQLLGFYYLVLWKGYPKKENT